MTAPFTPPTNLDLQRHFVPQFESVYYYLEEEEEQGLGLLQLVGSQPLTPHFKDQHRLGFCFQ